MPAAPESAPLRGLSSAEAQQRLIQYGPNEPAPAPRASGLIALLGRLRNPLVIILLLEIWPMTTLIRWRIQARRGTSIDMTVAPMLARISVIQAGLVILMVFAATAVARGYFY